MSRFSKSDWLKLAARLLGEEGPSALTVERMTEAAGRTRGSLYHHFQSREGLLVALMDWWRAQLMEGGTERFMAASNDDQLRDRIREEPLFWDTRFERGVRQLAVTEPIVAAALEEIDEARIAGTAEIIARLRPDVDDPQSLAFIQYAVVVGLQWLVRPGDPRWNAVAAAGYKLFGLSDPEGE
ncbi:MAG: TetR/AcrR family transcriptional regulator [Novosphingobium sp.]|nr:TetR/AcrR family transcriptional regulator [Novosphingobium sp.]